MQSDTLPDLPPAARALLRYWKTERGRHVMPYRTAIDPTRLRPWLSDLSIIERREGEKQFYVRLHGVGTMENFGQDHSRRFLEDIASGSGIQVAIQPYKTSISALLPTFSSIEPEPLNGILTRLDRLVLPFTDVDQDHPDAPVSVDRFLTWVAPTDQGFWINGVYTPEMHLPGQSRVPASQQVTVIDVDDSRYGLGSSNQSTKPSAARRPYAQHA